MSNDDDTNIRDNAAQHRYEAIRAGKVAGFVDYRMHQGTIEIVHTEVAPEFEGQGIAGRLARHALDDARRRGLRVMTSCSYMRSYVERHPEYEDLVQRS